MENRIEQEIADLTKQIEAKRRILESEKGIIEEKEIVRDVVAEKISGSIPSFSSQKSQIKNDKSISYLDNVDSETEETVNGLISIAFSKGIEAAIKEAENYDAYIMDAFHDAMTDKVYDQMKSQGLVK